MIENNICLQCDEKQWSIMDRNYLQIFGHCWYCDKILWGKHLLSTDEFEKRELEALSAPLTDLSSKEVL